MIAFLESFDRLNTDTFCVLCGGLLVAVAVSDRILAARWSR